MFAYSKTDYRQTSFAPSAPSGAGQHSWPVTLAPKPAFRARRVSGGWLTEWPRLTWCMCHRCRSAWGQRAAPIPPLIRAQAVAGTEPFVSAAGVFVCDYAGSGEPRRYAVTVPRSERRIVGSHGGAQHTQSVIATRCVTRALQSHTLCAAHCCAGRRPAALRRHWQQLCCAAVVLISHFVAPVVNHESII